MSLDISLLRTSLEAIKPVANQFVDYFYNDLFLNHPELSKLFVSKNKASQHKALIESLVYIVGNIDRPEALGPYLEQMGSRHVRYGVVSQHYPIVAESFLATLKYFFDESWTEELNTTWSLALAAIAEKMQAKAKQVVSDDKQNIVESMEKSLMDLMRKSLFAMAEDQEIRALAREKTKALIHDLIENELTILQQQYKQKKAA